MRIRLEEARRQPYPWSETVEVPADSLERDEVAALSPARWRGQLRWMDPGFLLRAELEYEQTLRCMRCLTEFDEPVAVVLELMVLQEDEPEEEELELQEEELGLLFVAGETLDTRPLLDEQLQLNVPMKPLCRPDCRGLCPVCGADRNGEGCDCKVDSVDPRWAGLAGLRERLAADEPVDDDDDEDDDR